jgi:hypothetical protein
MRRATPLRSPHFVGYVEVDESILEGVTTDEIEEEVEEGVTFLAGRNGLMWAGFDSLSDESTTEDEFRNRLVRFAEQFRSWMDKRGSDV